MIVILVILFWNWVVDFVGSLVRYIKRCLVFVFFDGFNVMIFLVFVIVVMCVYFLIVFIGG